MNEKALIKYIQDNTVMDCWYGYKPARLMGDFCYEKFINSEDFLHEPVAEYIKENLKRLVPLTPVFGSARIEPKEYFEKRNTND